MLAALLLAGCAGEGRRSETGLTRIRVVARPHLSVAPVLLARAEGYFRAEGLDVEIVSLASSREGLPALIRGDIDVVTSTLSTPYFAAMAQGAGIRVVADKGRFTANGCDYVTLLTRPDMLSGGRLQRPPDGRPWRFSARRGSLYEFLVERAVAQEAIRREDVELHAFAAESELQALVQGRIDVAVSGGPGMQRLVAAGQAAVWRGGGGIAPDQQFAVLLYGPSLLERDRDAGVRFMTAYLRAVRQYNEGKTDRNLEILERETGVDRQTLASACWIAIDPEGRIDGDSVLALQEWTRRRGLLLRELTLAELWDPSFVEAAATRL
jgi:NitT/TauT family transport system substrate-binding protein